MTVPPSALTTLRESLVATQRRLSRAASVVARAGLGEPADEAPATGAGADDAAESVLTASPDPTGPMLTILIAQRQFSAQLRALKTAEDAAKESVELTAEPREE